MKEKLEILSNTIVSYSLKVKENDRVLIESAYEAKPLLIQLVKDISKVGGIPVVRLTDSMIDGLQNELATLSRVPEMKAQAKYDVEHFDCFIRIRYLDNEYNFPLLPIHPKSTASHLFVLHIPYLGSSE